MQKQPDIPALLRRLKIESLNPMQEAALAANRAHAAIVLLSATGSGKTLAYLLPLLEKLDPERKGTQALVIAPTRELALQIEKVFKSLGTGHTVTCCYGGHLRETEENNLLENPSLIIGTPGRLADHIRRSSIHTEGIESVVLDEFDKILEFGFEEELAFIFGSLPALRHRVLVSATAGLDIPAFVGMHNSQELNFLEGTAAGSLQISYLPAGEADKKEMLFRLLCLWKGRSVIVFCNFREAVENTHAWLRDRGIPGVFYHGALEQEQREIALAKFRNGTADVLITTDLAARGLDIPHIRYIIHFQLPENREAFIHRNGRTARMDASGTALLLLGGDEWLPDYAEGAQLFEMPKGDIPLPEKTNWVTLEVKAGKKDKINKIDIVGFLSQKGDLKKDDIGLIEVKDYNSFVAVRRSKASALLSRIKDEKIKGRKVKFDFAR